MEGRYGDWVCFAEFLSHGMPGLPKVLDFTRNEKVGCILRLVLLSMVFRQK